MSIVIKESNETLKSIDITFEEIEKISKDYKKKSVINHPTETENPLEYILCSKIVLDDELIDIIKG